MFNKVIHGGKMPMEITWTLKVANTKDGMKMVKVAHTGAVTEDELEDISSLIEKYADTGVLDEMQRRPDTFLWVRARAIDADVPNENGDYFSEEELLAEVDAGKRGKIAAYKTFEGVPIYTNHKNDDIEQAKGKVVFAEWDNDKKCVYCTFFVDSEAYPQLARGIREGYIKDVSMGCQVDHSRCSICDNKALTEREYCDHVRTLKGRKYTGLIDKGPKKGKKVTDEPVYERNYEVKFIELSCVSDGAFENCEIEEILPATKMVKSKTEAITKEAESIEKVVIEAMNSGKIQSEEVKDLLVGSLNLVDDIKRLAQQQENRIIKQSQIFPSSPADMINPLSGQESDQQIVPVAGEGQASPQDEPIANPTDPTSTGQGVGINTLDALKDVIRNINTVIVTLLSTKGINLEHVRDLSKSVADIQDTIEDMIDSGSIDVSGSVPIAGNQNLPASAPPPPAGAGAPPPPQGSPTYNTPPEGVGLQVGASSNNRRMVKGLVKLTKLKENLQKFSNNFANKYPQHKEESGIMSDFKKLAATLREQKLSEKNERYEQERDGYRIALASNGQITAYYKNTEVDWKPEITEELVEKIDGGMISEATSDLLTQFSTSFSDGKRIRRVSSVGAETPSAGTEVRFQDKDATWPIGRLGNPGYPMEQYIENARKGAGSNREDDLGEVRTGVDERVKEQQLEDRSVGEGSLGRAGVDERAREHQLEEVRRGADVRQEENRVGEKRATGDATVVVASINEALSNAVIEAMVSPEEVVESAVRLASCESFNSLISEYASDENKKARANIRKRAKFYGTIKIASTDNLNVDSFVVGAIADVISSKVSVKDLAYGLSELGRQNIERYAGLVGQIAKDKIEKLGGNASNISQFEEDSNKQSEIRREFVKAMVNNDNSEPQYSRESVMSVVAAIAKTLVDNNLKSDDLLEVFASTEAGDLFADLEMAKEEDAINARKRTASRKKYWTQRTASDGTDLLSVAVGNIADSSLTSGISTKEAVDTINLLLSKKASTKEAIASAVRKIQRTAAQVTDRSEREFTVNFNLSECGCDKNDPDVESKIREYIVQLFEGKGYQLSDPQTLSFTSLDIREDGTVCGTIRSTVTRSFKAEAEGMGGMEDMGAVSEMGPEALVSEGMITARRNNRSALLKAAQMMGGDMGGSPGLAGGAGGDPAAAAGGADPGIAAISGGGEPGASDEQGDDKSPEESIPTPGQIAPPGSICLACGSTDVDVADGHGKCNDCGAEMNISFNVELTNPEIFNGVGEAGGMDELGEEDMGMELPEETAPEAGAPGQAPGAPGMGAPGMGAGQAPATPMAMSNLRRVIEASAKVPQLVRISWVSEPDVFLRTALAQKGEIQQTASMAPGHVCPTCGDKKNITRVAGKDKTNMYCDSCGFAGVIDVEAAKGNKLRNSITWVI